MDPLKLKSQNQANNIPAFFSGSPVKVWDKLSKWVLSYDRTNKQIDKKSLQLYLYTDK